MKGYFYTPFGKDSKENEELKLSNKYTACSQASIDRRCRTICDWTIQLFYCTLAFVCLLMLSVSMCVFFSLSYVRAEKKERKKDSAVAAKLKEGLSQALFSRHSSVGYSTLLCFVSSTFIPVTSNRRA